MSIVTVKHVIDSENINIIHDWGQYVIAQVYQSATDSDYVYSYLKFDQMYAENEDGLINEFYLNRSYIDRYSYGFIIGKIDEIESEDEYKTLLINIDAEETGTEGPYSFVICLAYGGEMGEPEYKYSHFQIVKALNKEEAIWKYNEINGCVYFKGHFIGEVVEDADE